MKMPNLLRLFYMSVWRELLTSTRYKVNFIFDILSSALWGFGMLIFVVAFDKNLFGSTVGSTNSIAFLIFGVSYQAWTGIALWGAPGMLQGELSSGQIDYTFTCPFSRYFYILSNIAASLFRNTLFFLPMFLVGLYFTMETLTPLGLLLGLVASVISVASLAQLGVMFASLVLKYKEISAVFSFINFAFQMLTGMFIPVQLLPIPLRLLGYCLPITFRIDLLRHYVMNTNTIMPIINEWEVLLAQLIILAIIAKITVLYLERIAKEEGLHYI